MKILRKFSGWSMHRIVACLLLLACFKLSYATAVTLQAISINEKPAYELLVGTFPHHNNALQFKFSLASLIKEPLEIEQKQNTYIVKVGPIFNEASALLLQKKIQEDILPNKLMSMITPESSLKPSKDAIPLERQGVTSFTASKPLNNFLNTVSPYDTSSAMNTPAMHSRTLITDPAMHELSVTQPFHPSSTAAPMNTLERSKAYDQQGSHSTLENPQLSHEPTPSTHSLNQQANTSNFSALAADTADTPDKKLWNLRNADIRAVIAEISRITGKNFIIDPRVQGKISIVSSTPLSDKSLYEVFLSMLQISGYAAIPSGHVTKIIPNIDAKTQSPDELTQIRNIARGDEMMVSVIPVHHVPVEQLVPILRPLMPAWSNVSAYAPSNMLILSGRANNLKQVVRIIKQVDDSSLDDVDIISLKHSLAMDIANTLKELIKTQPNYGTRAQMKLAVDDRNNALLLNGNKTDRIRLRMLITKLDRPRPGANSNTKVVYLNYLRAEDLVPILAGVAQANFSGTVGTTVGTITRPELDSTNPASNLAYPASSAHAASSNTSSSNNSTSTPNAAATPTTTAVGTQSEGGTKPSIQIIAEPNTNSIILNAPSALIRILTSVIHQLDVRPAQLLIEALIAEVDEHDFNSLGIEWGSIPQTGEQKAFQPGFAILNASTSLKNLQAQIYALAKDRRANILSTPSVVVLDNHQAKILVGEQVSITTTTYPNNAGGTTTASPYVTYDRVNVALHLYVRPQITRGDGIQLQIDQGNETIDRAEQITNNPVFKISSIVTSVHIDNGNIIALGGLAQDILAGSNTRLPILGDLPGLGRLFQNNIQNRQKRVLIVFIRPCILRNKNDDEFMSMNKFNEVREQQLDVLHTQPYNPYNNRTLLPNLNQATLPRPFMRGASVENTAALSTMNLPPSK